MQSLFLTYQSSRIHYLRGGHGKKLLLCFHGYGETADSFTFLEPALSEEFSLLAIDLPFHGKTEWKEGLSFDRDQLWAIVRKTGFLETDEEETTKEGETVTPAGDSRSGSPRLWLMGFSLGGRIALSLLEKIPDRIAKIVLLAPDGLKMNPWYWLATQNPVGNRLFHFTMQHPGWFFLILRIGRKLHLTNPSVYKFSAQYIRNPVARKELYLRWTTMRKFRPHISRIPSLVMARNLPLRLLYGKFDRIILSVNGERLLKGIPILGRLMILQEGHRLLQRKHLDLIRTALME